MLLSETASAQLSLTSTTGTMASPVYHYDITVTDTGTTKIGTFWFSWVPGEDFLPSAPLSESSPAGWGSAVTGGGQNDGSAIQWVASSNAITPGNSLGGFVFTSSDSPTALAGNSPFYPSTAVLTSFVYGGGPESDAGFKLTVTQAAALAASTTTVVPSQSTITEGGPVTFTATVAPSSGSGAAPTGSVTFLEDGTSIGTEPVQTNGTAALTTSTLPSGSLSITAQYSGDSTYSGSTSSGLTETVNTSSAPTTATLVPTIAKSSLPAALVAGAAAHGAVTLDITDATANAVKGKVMLELFASTDGAIDGSSVELAQVARAIDVKTTARLVESLPVRITATKLPAGSYTLLARVVDPSGGNNDSSTGPALAVAAPMIALAETFSKVTIPTSVGAGTKSHAVAVLEITNNGNITTPATTTAALFATVSGIVDSTATKINSVTRPLRIQPGKSVLVTIPVKEIPAIAVGPYTIVAQVTDPNGTMTTATSEVVNIVTAAQDSSSPPSSPPYNY